MADKKLSARDALIKSVVFTGRLIGQLLGSDIADSPCPQSLARVRRRKHRPLPGTYALVALVESHALVAIRWARVVMIEMNVAIATSSHSTLGDVLGDALFFGVPLCIAIAIERIIRRRPIESTMRQLWVEGQTREDNIFAASRELRCSVRAIERVGRNIPARKRRWRARYPQRYMMAEVRDHSRRARRHDAAPRPSRPRRSCARQREASHGRREAGHGRRRTTSRSPGGGSDDGPGSSDPPPAAGTHQGRSS